MKRNNGFELVEVDKHKVKCRFFAQYWGTKTMYVGGVGLVEIGTGGWNLKHPDFFLELKPLSKITDEDLINVANIGFNFNQKVTHFKVETKAVYGYYIMPSESKYVRLDVPHIDYLRSKGYALPFMEYSIDELVELGWVRLV